MLRLAEYIANRYKKVAEIGIGGYTAVAEYLSSKGVKVIATDIRDVQTGVEFFIDDVRNPRISLYNGVELVYSIRPPPELFKSIRELAMRLNADCIIKPLYGDYTDGRIVNYKGLEFYLWNRNDI
ncbi:MAG: hypothetical protein HA489_05970 [Archaeoglobales archaeon]|jgi:uncharacterized UPF0146 family protein|nr:UPF0146 family protein [Archaeoglobi archaeon]NHW23779.1 hypothetical protein [Archaeoglobales archaeon]TDA29662.1 MAG: hypothetical protein DSO00_03620 [Archaeoglobi archaeon]